MNIYLAVYLIIGAWLAGMSPTKSLWRNMALMLMWPIALLVAFGMEADERKGLKRAADAEKPILCADCGRRPERYAKGEYHDCLLTNPCKRKCDLYYKAP
jgi:hypothetical protein